MFVIKDGMIHKCNTKERYNSFLASGWEPYKIEPKKKSKNNKQKNLKD